MKTGLKTLPVAGVYLAFVVLAIYAIIKIIDIQFVHKPEKVANNTKEETLECLRGGILSDDGRYFAFSVPRYVLYMDCVQPKDTIFNAGIDSLSICLAELYGDRSAAQYKKRIVDGRLNGKRYMIINGDRKKNMLTYQQMKQASGFPIFNKGRSYGGVIFETIDYREYPYDRLAFRTLGYIKSNGEKPTIGLEGSLDSVLSGQRGVQYLRETEHHEWIPDSERETVYPVDGMDVQTTINIEIQHIAQKALLSKLKENDLLSAGTVIVMEVATGEIKAMVNMMKTDNGTFDEVKNYAIAERGNPGSVFKLATLTMLLDDHKVTLDTKIKAETNWHYKNLKKPFEDKYLKAYDSISVLRGFEISSNNVFRMLSARYYDSNPEAFVQRYKDIKICYTFPFEIKGMAKDSILSPKDKHWSDSDLPQIGMGYVVELTPLHTLNFYNAIANNGVMVKPHLVRNYQKNGAIVKAFDTEIIDTVCTPSTVKDLHKALRGVVTDGTAKSIFKDCKVAVAGKTGTARILDLKTGKYEVKINGQTYKQHQATFAGFFPYESPKYSVIAVVYSTLSTKDFYGGTWAAPVVREIAEEIYLASPSWNAPVRENGKLPEIPQYENYSINDTLQGVPDLLGMGLKEGLYLLEQKGYRASFTGKGRISQQFPAPGVITDQKNIKLILSEELNHVFE